MVARMKPELVSPMVAYLCSEQCIRSGEVWAAGVGYFSRVELREGNGVRIPGQPTIEDVADNIDKIADLTANTAYRTANEESQAVLAG
jgi:hypothetical protein